MDHASGGTVGTGGDPSGKGGKGGEGGEGGEGGKTGATAPSARAAWGYGAIAATACLLYGYCSGVTAGAQLYLARAFHLSSTTRGLVVSLFLAGAAVGALVAGRISDRLGRRPALGVSALLFGVGLVLSTIAPGLALMLVGRVVQGLAAGIASAVVPVYLNEIATDDDRGRLGTLNQLMVTIGLLISYLVALAFSGAGDWRAMFGVGLAGVGVLLLGLPVMKESPAWLRREHLPRAGEERVGLRALWGPAARPALLIGLALCALQQFCGVNAVLYFAPTIIETTGLSASNAIQYSVYIGALNVLMTLVAIRLIDRWGRRPLMLLSTGGMCVALVPLGATFVWHPPGRGALALVCLLAFVASFAIGAGPVVWLMLSELFPERERALGTGVCTMVNWVSNFVVNQFFLTVVGAIGQGETFWLFAGVCLLGVLFVARYVPETKGRSESAIAAALHA